LLCRHTGLELKAWISVNGEGRGDQGSYASPGDRRGHPGVAQLLPRDGGLHRERNAGSHRSPLLRQGRGRLGFEICGGQEVLRLHGAWAFLFGKEVLVYVCGDGEAHHHVRRLHGVGGHQERAVWVHGGGLPVGGEWQRRVCVQQLRVYSPMGQLIELIELRSITLDGAGIGLWIPMSKNYHDDVLLRPGTDSFFAIKNWSRWLVCMWSCIDLLFLKPWIIRLWGNWISLSSIDRSIVGILDRIGCLRTNVHAPVLLQEWFIFCNKEVL